MQNVNEEIVRILDLLPVSSLEKPSSFKDELQNTPLYTIEEEGVLKINPGIKSNGKELFFDVSNASQKLRNAYADSIIEYVVRKVVGSQNQKRIDTDSAAGKIVSVLSLLGEYQNLTAIERSQVGDNFVTIESTEEGLKINPLITVRGNQYPGNTYLLVDPSTLKSNLKEKLIGDTTELIQMQNGLYKQNEVMNYEKEL